MFHATPQSFQVTLQSLQDLGDTLARRFLGGGDALEKRSRVLEALLRLPDPTVKVGAAAGRKTTHHVAL